MAAKPQPRVVTEVCSLCGLDWKRHGKNPTADKCIELLLAEVRSLNARLATWPYSRPYIVPAPYPVPYTPPWRPWQPYWGGKTYSTGIATTTLANVTTPQLASGTPRPVPR